MISSHGLLYFLVIAVAFASQRLPIEYHKYELGIPPDDCIADKEKALQHYKYVEQFEKCAPFLLPNHAWRYYLGASGLRSSFRENFKAYRRLCIIPKILRDVSQLKMSATVLGQRISIPVGASPVALQKFASKLGEIDTVRAIDKARTVMIVSSSASATIEDIAKAAPNAIKWMQTYIHKDREFTRGVVRRAEAAGFKAIVVTVDAPIDGPIELLADEITGRNPEGIKYEILPFGAPIDDSITFEDLAWMTTITNLPIVAKGVLTGEDAIRAAKAGVSAILVSNHGGRQLDFVPATIDALPGVVDALKYSFPDVEVYVDGGVRNGYDVFKALGRGAKMVFIGRPIVWGLTYGGEIGFTKIIDILRDQLNSTMKLAGTPNVYSIDRKMIIDKPAMASCGYQEEDFEYNF